MGAAGPPQRAMSDIPAPIPAHGELRWRVHPAGRQPTRAAVLVAVILVAALLSWRVSGSALMGLFALLILGASLRAWFLPREYVLDGEGAGETGPLCSPRRLAWSDVRRVSSLRDGVHLSPRHSDSRLLPDRGVFLRIDRNREQVLAFVSARRVAS